jgi:hypothetical protein
MHQIRHQIKASIIDGPTDRKVLPPIVTPSVDKTKTPSISFSNLPVPARVKEIKIKAQKLPNGFSFVLTWDEDPLTQLEQTIKSVLS